MNLTERKDRAFLQILSYDAAQLNGLIEAMKENSNFENDAGRTFIAALEERARQMREKEETA